MHFLRHCSSFCHSLFCSKRCDGWYLFAPESVAKGCSVAWSFQVEKKREGGWEKRGGCRSTLFSTKPCGSISFRSLARPVSACS